MLNPPQPDPAQQGGNLILSDVRPDRPDVARRIKPGQRARVLKHESRGRGQIGRHIAHPDLAFIAPLQPADHPQKGRLADAGRPDQRDHLAGRDLQRQRAEHGNRSGRKLHAGQLKAHGWSCLHLTTLLSTGRSTPCSNSITMAIKTVV